jgi:hypothetical protein
MRSIALVPVLEWYWALWLSLTILWHFKTSVLHDGFQDPTVVIMKSTIFWGVMWLSLLVQYILEEFPTSIFRIKVWDERAAGRALLLACDMLGLLFDPEAQLWSLLAFVMEPVHSWASDSMRQHSGALCIGDSTSWKSVIHNRLYEHFKSAVAKCRTLA